MDYALIKSGAVENVIAADEAFIDAIRGDWDHIEPLRDGAGVGWGWDGQRFVEPLPETPPPGSGALPRHITVGAFFDRFGALKWAILADSNPQVQAVIRDASVRTYIDLDNADLPAGLALLQAAGHAIDADAVIDAPVQQQERP